MAEPSASSRSARRAQRRRRGRRRFAFVVAALLAVAAAGAGAYALTRSDEGSSKSVEAPPKSTTTTFPPESTTTTVARDPVRGSGQPVVFAFGGDVHFAGSLRSKLDADPNAMLAPIAPVLSTADVAVVNLETAISEGDPPATKQYVFRAPATSLDALRAAGVDAASLANNHGLDYGPQGLAESLAARDARQFPLLGVGNNATEAFTPYRVEVKGQRVAVFGATDVIDGEYVGAWTATDAQAGLASSKDLTRLVAAVQAARLDSDTVVVFLHWGAEGQACPSVRQQEVANALTGAGADIVVGSHTHRLQGGGRLGTAFVDYGLGNFVFYNEAGEAGRTGVLLVTATGRAIDSYQWVPARIVGGVPQPIPAGPQADAEVAAWDELRACTGLTP